MVIIGYLKSYECRGIVKVYVKGQNSDDYNLINSTMERHSQIYTHRVCLNKHIICHNSSTVDNNNILPYTPPAGSSHTTHATHTIQLIIELLPVSTSSGTSFWSWFLGTGRSNGGAAAVAPVVVGTGAGAGMSGGGGEGSGGGKGGGSVVLGIDLK